MKILSLLLIFVATLLSGCPGGPSDLEVNDEISAMRDAQIVQMRKDVEDSVANDPSITSKEQVTKDRLAKLNSGEARRWMDMVDNMRPELAEIAHDNWESTKEERAKLMRKKALAKFNN